MLHIMCCFQPTRKICVGFLLLFCCIDPSLCYIWPWYRILFYYHSDDCNQRVIISITCWSIHPGYFIFLLSPLLLLLLLNNQPQYIRTFTFTITITHIIMSWLTVFGLGQYLELHYYYYYYSTINHNIHKKTFIFHFGIHQLSWLKHLFYLFWMFMFFPSKHSGQFSFYYPVCVCY